MSDILVKIAQVVPMVFTDEKIRRGELHTLVCQTLSLPVSNENVKLIKAILAAQGIRSVVIHGKEYYVSYPAKS